MGGKIQMTFKRMLLSIVIVLLLLMNGPVGTPAVLAQTTTGLKPYDEVITADAESRTGVFTVHKVGDKHYLEIPTSALTKEMLWYAELSEVSRSVGFAKLAVHLPRVVKWERRDNRVFVRDLTSAAFAQDELPEPGDPIEVEPIEIVSSNLSLPSIMLTFDVITEGPDGSPVVDVSETFATNIPEFNVLGSLKDPQSFTGPDRARSFVESIKTFPTNIEIKSFLTFTKGSSTASQSVAIVVNHSLALLPEKPMMPRYADERVGYFTTQLESLIAGAGIPQREFISRFRLEKKDPTAALSEPVQPIVFYIGEGVPEKWRPYVKQAVEDWQVAFEAAGFKNAIIAMDPPSKEENPDWDPADVRYSVVRWLDNDAAGANGPRTYDPRSGEILSAHIVVEGALPKLLEQWYFLQAAANDPQARTLPLPDEIMGQMIRYAVSHEVGHSLGLRHNFRGSQAFTIEQLRDPDFANEMGPVASIMSYGRINYVAQPGDGITRFIPKIGPYDLWAINYGYRPIPEASTPKEELETLRTWAAEVESNPYLAFGGEDSASTYDPNVNKQIIGSERVEATRLGLANLERAMDYLVPAATSPEADYGALAEMYEAAIKTRETWIASVVKLIGGVEDTDILDPTRPRFVRVDRASQEAAVEFLVESLRTPTAFVRPDIFALTSPFTAMDPLILSQTSLLQMYLDLNLFSQLNDNAMVAPEDAYLVVDYLTALQNGVWEELETDDPLIDPIRRELQRVYLQTLEEKMNTKPSKGAAAFAKVASGIMGGPVPSAVGNDFPAVAKALLRDLAERLEQAIPLTTDPTTRAHLQDALEQVLDMVGAAAPVP